jgi:hypothetical protein
MTKIAGRKTVQSEVDATQEPESAPGGKSHPTPSDVFSEPINDKYEQEVG